MDIKITAKSTFTGVTLQDVRNYIKFEDVNTNEDILIEQMLNAAVESIEKYCRIALRSKTIQVIFDDFDIDEGKIILPIAPFSSLTSLHVITSLCSETEDTDPTYTASNQPEIKTNLWAEGEKIKVVYVAGYGLTNMEPIPDIIPLAIYKTVAEWYEKRDEQGVLSGEIRKLLNQVSYSAWI